MEEIRFFWAPISFLSSAFFAFMAFLDMISTARVSRLRLSPGTWVLAASP